MTNCQVEEDVAKTEQSTNREELFFKDAPNSKQSRNEGNSIETFLKNENEETQFLQKLSDQKGIPIWKNLKTFKNKSLTSKNSGSSKTIIPLSDNDKNLSSLLFVDSKTNGKATIYTITNEQLFKIVSNTKIPKETRETILMEFLYFDYLSFGEREYSNIPIDLFSNVKAKKGKNYKQFKIKINDSEKSSSVTSRQASDICVTFYHCYANVAYCTDQGCSTTQCYSFGGSSDPLNYGDPVDGGGGGGSDGDGGGGTSGGSSSSSTPWYLINPDIDIYTYNTKIRSLFKALTDYKVVLQREQLDYLNTNIVILNDLTALLVNNSQEKSEFTNNVISALNDGVIKTYKEFVMAMENFKYSLKSPCNVDLSSILENPTLPENEKFKTIYDALTTSPQFQKLFLAIFGSDNRFNVKFEIADHVYEDNDPAKKEVNATTSQNPANKNITIKISKQILIAGTPKSQTKIENAKTILHECIHAYLFVKANNPTVGVDFVKILNTMYPTPNEQHDFMYGKMIPTMQKVLGEIRDSVTTAPKRANIEAYTMHPTTNPISSNPFNWQDFYKHLSYSGLDETSSFKQDFPNPSDALRLHQNYIDAGKNELDR